MANPDEGEVEFEARGKRWTISFSNRTLRAIEKRVKRPIGKLLADMQTSTSVDELVSIFHLGLKPHHPDITEDGAGDLVLMGQLMKVVTEALTLAINPGDEGKKESGNSAHPPEPGQIESTGSAT